MFEKASEALIYQLKKREIVVDEDVEIYQFGIKVLMLKTVHYASMLLVGLLFGMLPETILFLIVYAAIRA